MRKKGGIREKIRNNFAKAGRPYVVPKKYDLMPHVYVRPSDEFDEKQIDWFK